MLRFLDYLLIHPLMLLFDIIFSVLYGLIENVGITILALSVVVNFLILPLYRKADLLQQEQHLRSSRIKKWSDHIRNHFAGDKRFFMLSAYYKIEGYSPLSSLQEAIPLLLQIPFFIAAYRYISSLPVLNGVSFWIIRDLLEPDRMLVVSGITVNLLPVVMTVINCISGLIYAKDHRLSQLARLFCVAMVFLILLYNCPSGLVLYWTMNNIFSLIKNIYYRYFERYSVFVSAVGPFIPIFLLMISFFTQRVDKDIDVIAYEFIIAFVIIKSIITVAGLKHYRLPSALDNVISDLSAVKGKELILLMIVPDLCLVILWGYYIPTSVIASSPVEFISRSTGRFDVDLLLYPLLVYTGLLILWSTVMILSQEKIKRIIAVTALWSILGGSLYNYFYAKTDTGTLYTDLSFDEQLSFSAVSIVINIIVTVVCALLLASVVIRKHKPAIRIGSVIAVALLFLSVNNTVNIVRTLKSNTTVTVNIEGSDTPIVLSRNGRNVVVIMLDRAISGYVPYIFEEKTELTASYDGFVYYPNTVSFGLNTKFGTPGLFGGYEYTPFESDKRADVTLKDKQNEALMLMPVLFMNEGYNVTVCDPPYANYQEIPDLSIYDDYPDINTYNLTGLYTDDYNVMLQGGASQKQEHNFIMYSIFRTVPLFMREAVYDDGDYLAVSISYSSEMLDSYSVLWKLPDITSITEDEEGSFLMLQNSITHCPAYLIPPDYSVDGTCQTEEYDYSDLVCDGRVMRLDNDTQWRHYCINMATYQVLAEWLDYLKAEDVYDNTRIILVSDHGSTLWQFDDLIHPSGVHVEAMIPLLMVKDFDSHGELRTDNTFMTNADVPLIAMDGVIDHPVNPFTGVPVDDSIKREGYVIVTNSGNWLVRDDGATTYDLEDGEWWIVHDDIFDMDNWTRY